MQPNEDAAFDALADRVRREILAVLGDSGELTAGEISQRIVAVGRTTVSSHLRVLRTSGLVRERREGRNRLYCLDVDGAVRDALVFLHSILRQGVECVDAPEPPSTAPGSGMHAWPAVR